MEFDETSSRKPLVLADGLQAMHYDVVLGTMGMGQRKSPNCGIKLTILAIDLDILPCKQQLIIACRFSATLCSAMKG